jgi:predicted esterase
METVLPPQRCANEQLQDGTQETASYASCTPQDSITSRPQIKQLGDAIGRERILVLHGQSDAMINFIHAEMLLRELGGEESGVTKSFHKDVGHLAPYEIRKEFNKIIAERIESTEPMAKS